MQVTRLQLGVYANQQPFCLYLLPLASSSDVVHSPSESSSSPRQPIAQYLPFYRLRDIDCIFFESCAGYVLNSGKIPQIYLDTPGYCFRERSDDVYLAARALSETATRLGNHLLAEFCKLGKAEILSGTADRLLNNVPIKRTDFVEAQFEFIAVDTKTLSPSPMITESLPTAPSSSGHLSPPQVNNRKRMSLEDILDKDDSHDQRGSPMIKQEPSPAYSGSDNSSPTSPNHMSRSPRSPSSPNSADLSVLIEDDTRMRKKRRVANSSNNIRVTNNPEVMEQVRNTLKLKQQQKAIIEARQHQSQVDRRHSVAVTRMTSQGAWDGSKTAMSKRNSVSTHNRNNRNSRNLSVFAPPYNGKTSFAVSPHFSPTRGFSGQQNSQNTSSSTGRHDSPMITPITPTMINRPVSRMSVSGYPFSANSAFRPIQNVHSASTSANINGLISPKNIEFRSSSSSSSSSPNQSSSPSSTSSMSQLHDLAQGDQANKESFINLFDSFYDALSDSQQLKTTLEEQIRKSATLMQTLQTSGVMIESLVRDHFQEMQREVVRDLMMLEKRISKVEAHVRYSPAVIGMTASPPLDTDRRLSNTSTSSSNSNAGSPYTPPQSQHHLRPSGTASPPLSASSIRSETDGLHSKDYEGVLSALKARLESLERRMSVP